MESSTGERGDQMEYTADSDELQIVTEEELRQQQFTRHESKKTVPPIHQSPDEPNMHDPDPDINEREGTIASVLRVSADGDTDLLGRPLRPYITPLTRPVRTKEGRRKNEQQQS